MNNETFFNLGSWGYDLLTDQDLWRDQIRSVLDHVDDPGQVREVLDLGCGPGVSAFVLAGRLPDATVTGIDIASKMIDRAHRHHRKNFATLENVNFEVADATNLRFEDGRFDLAVGHSFLYLVPDRHAVLAEVRRVLAPGGLLVLMEPRREGSLAGAASRGFGADYSAATAWDSVRMWTSMALWRMVSGSVGRLPAAQVEEWMLDAGFDSADVVPTLGGLGMHCLGRVAR